MRLLHEQLESIRRQAPVELACHVGAAFTVVGAVYALMPAQLRAPLVWACALVLAVGACYLLQRRGLGDLKWLLWWRALAGTLWGAAPWLVMLQGADPLIAVLNGVTLLLAACMLTSSVVNLSAFGLFAVPVFVSHASRLAWIGGDFHLTLACMDILALAAVMLLARRLALLAGNDLRLRNRARELEQHLQWTRRAFRDQEIRARREEALARQVFDRLTRQRTQAQPEISRWVQPTGSFSGDLLLHTYSPCGSLNLLLADFSGHGLPAALGAIPVSSVFHTMTRKEHSPRAIVTELNQRLAEMLPVDYFCCATLLRVSPDRSRMEVCNAGLPPLLIVGADGEIKGRYESTLLPLGIVPDTPLPEAPVATLRPDDVVYLFSDGLIETHNLRGEMFGLVRLERELACRAPRQTRVDTVKSAVVDFIGVMEPDDDISLIELHLQRAAAPAIAAQAC